MYRSMGGRKHKQVSKHLGMTGRMNEAGGGDVDDAGSATDGSSNGVVVKQIELEKAEA